MFLLEIDSRNSEVRRIRLVSVSTISGEFALFGAMVTLIMSKLLTIIHKLLSSMATKTTIHPGEILMEEFLVPLELSQYRLAQEINVPRRRINEIIQSKRSVSADTALRLAKFFGTTPEFWMNLQMYYDLAKQEAEVGKNVYKAVPTFCRA